MCYLGELNTCKQNSEIWSKVLLFNQAAVITVQPAWDKHCNGLYYRDLCKNKKLIRRVLVNYSAAARRTYACAMCSTCHNMVRGAQAAD